jgi:hypothetical protein
LSHPDPNKKCERPGFLTKLEQGKLLSILQETRSSVRKGNLLAFHDFLNIKFKTAPLIHLPYYTDGHTITAAHSKLQNIQQFVEVLAETDKLQELLNVVLKINDEKTYPKTKILIFAAENNVEDVMFFLTENLQNRSHLCSISRITADTDAIVRLQDLNYYDCEDNGILILSDTAFVGQQLGMCHNYLSFFSIFITLCLIVIFQICL